MEGKGLVIFANTIDSIPIMGIFLFAVFVPMEDFFLIAMETATDAIIFFLLLVIEHVDVEVAFKTNGATEI